MPEQGYPQTSPLQIFPQGLLGLLQLKNGGEMPQRLGSNELLPVMDLRRWYLETNAEIISNNPIVVGAAAGNVSFGSMVVPAREWWHVSAFFIEAQSIGAGDVATGMQATVIIAAAGVPVPIGERISITGAAGTGAVQFGALCDFWLPPNSGFGANLEAIAGAFNYVPQARITRLPI